MSKIVVASDLSDRSTLAIRRALLLAQSLQADLTLLHVCETSDVPTVTAAHAALDQALDQALEQALGQALDPALEQQALDPVRARSTSAELRIEKRVVCGDACDVIVQFASTADLLVLGEPRRHTLREFFIGSTAHRIMKGLSTPGLMVRTRAEEPYRRLVFAVDFSQASVHAIERALELGMARENCAAVHVYDLARIDLMVEASSYSMAHIKEQVRRETAKIERKLSALMKKSGLRGQPAAILAKASPADSLLVFARTYQADLIVLGNRRRSNLAKIVLGSVAEETLVNAPCDILLVPTRSA